MSPHEQRPRRLDLDGERNTINNSHQHTNPDHLGSDLRTVGRLTCAGGPDALAAEFALALLGVALAGVAE